MGDIVRKFHLLDIAIVHLLQPRSLASLDCRTHQQQLQNLQVHCLPEVQVLKWGDLQTCLCSASTFQENLFCLCLSR